MRTKLKISAPSTIDVEFQLNATINEVKDFLAALAPLKLPAGWYPYEINKIVEPLEKAIATVEKEIHIWHEPNRSRDTK